MSSRLPQYVDPWRLADSGKGFSARVAITDLPRLAEAVLETAGEVGVTLAFGRDEQGRACVHGRVQASLVLECQRCLGPMSHAVDARLNLALVCGPEEAEQLPDAYDPLLVEESRLHLLDIVEEELLLSLPQVPRHEAGQCALRAGSEPTPAPLQQAAAERERPNPFAVLAGLKDKPN